jgi:zinc-binding alcohol dehydrogenase/oxidoreductase
MKAAILRQFHTPLRIEEIPKPDARVGEVLIRLKAAALNHRDLWIGKGLYPGAKVPSVLGSDGSGEVEAVGDPSLAHWLGKSVIINPAHHWGSSESHYGPEFRILGLEDDGTFAEYVRVKATFLAEKPSHLSAEQAAAIPLAGLTAWRSLMIRSALAPGDRVLVTGIGGGVAQFVMQFAVEQGAEVWVTSGSEDKIEKAVASGARGGVSYRRENWSRELLEQVGAGKRGYFDVIVDSACGPGFQRLVDVAAPGGRICFYGGTLGNITDLIPAKIFFKQLTILGTTMGSPADFEQMIRFVSERRLLPMIDSVFPLAEVDHAMERMERGEQFGKIVLAIG